MLTTMMVATINLHQGHRTDVPSLFVSSTSNLSRQQPPSLQENGSDDVLSHHIQSVIQTSSSQDLDVISEQPDSSSLRNVTRKHKMRLSHGYQKPRVLGYRMFLDSEKKQTQTPKLVGIQKYNMDNVVKAKGYHNKFGSSMSDEISPADVYILKKHPKLESSIISKGLKNLIRRTNPEHDDDGNRSVDTKTHSSFYTSSSRSISHYPPIELRRVGTSLIVSKGVEVLASPTLDDNDDLIARHAPGGEVEVYIPSKLAEAADKRTARRRWSPTSRRPLHKTGKSRNRRGKVDSNMSVSVSVEDVTCDLFGSTLIPTKPSVDHEGANFPVQEISFDNVSDMNPHAFGQQSSLSDYKPNTRLQSYPLGKQRSMPIKSVQEDAKILFKRSISAFDKAMGVPVEFQEFPELQEEKSCLSDCKANTRSQSLYPIKKKISMSIQSLQKEAKILFKRSISAFDKAMGVPVEYQEFPDVQEENNGLDSEEDLYDDDDESDILISN